MARGGVSVMRPARQKPAVIEIVRRGRTIAYDLADFKDWAILFENMVLEIKARDGVTTYWPLDSITCWRVRDPAAAISPLNIPGA